MLARRNTTIRARVAEAASFGGEMLPLLSLALIGYPLGREVATSVRIQIISIFAIARILLGTLRSGTKQLSPR